MSSRLPRVLSALAAVLLTGCAAGDPAPPGEPVAPGCEQPGEQQPSAMATYPVYRDVADLVATADVIVRGAAISCRAGMSYPLPPTSADPAAPQTGAEEQAPAEAPGTPIAITTVRVTEAIKGEVTEGDLVEVARTTHTDEPQLELGEDSDHVLLLAADFPDLPRWPLNPTQGVYRVVGGEDLERDADVDHPVPASLEELRAAAAQEAACPRPEPADPVQALAAMTSAFAGLFSDDDPAESPRALAESSDVVVRGRVARFQPGRTEVVIGTGQELGTSPVVVLTGVEVAAGALAGAGEEVFVELPRGTSTTPETLAEAFPACTEVVAYLLDVSDASADVDADVDVTSADPRAGRPLGEPLHILVNPEGFAVQSPLPYPATVVWPLAGTAQGTLTDVLPDGDLLPGS